MSSDILEICSGKFVDEENELTLEQICEICRIDSKSIIEMVDEGIFEPEGDENSSWRFSYSCVETVRIVTRMQKDLRINLPGAALVLQLLEQMK
ncbi:MAG: MerR family transcriptional regulator [Chlamydiae bacterium]|nr:MAG: MerR family transcriptional regulator [Chlamydiota bacterium]